MKHTSEQFSLFPEWNPFGLYHHLLYRFTSFLLFELSISSYQEDSEFCQ